MPPKIEFLNPDDFPEPHMEAATMSEAERLALELEETPFAMTRIEAAAELRRLAAVERACDGWKQVSKQWRGAAEIIHGMSQEDAQSLKELRADRDRLAAEVEALREGKAELLTVLDALEREFRKVFPIYYYAEPWAHDRNETLKLARAAIDAAKAGAA